MMSDYDRAFNRSMGHEGGIQFIPSDHGNTKDLGTYKGVAPAYWPKWPGWRFISAAMASLGRRPEYGTTAYKNYVSALNATMAANTELQRLVKDFYRANFWKRLGEVTDQRIAEETFDKAINCGLIAYKWLQRAVDCPDDGIIGSNTIKIVNEHPDPSAVLEAFNQTARDYYEAIIDRKPDQAQFRKSWLARLRNYDDTHFAA
jgi:lysozyme family protein